jgi:hypothetical protein
VLSIHGNVRLIRVTNRLSPIMTAIRQCCQASSSVTLSSISKAVASSLSNDDDDNEPYTEQEILTVVNQLITAGLLHRQ